MVLNNTNKNNSILLEVLASVFTVSSNFQKVKRRYLKLYCGYKYTKSCMINRIWGLKQL